MTEPKRCAWCVSGNDLYIAYHDEEWGVPVRDDRTSRGGSKSEGGEMVELLSRVVDRMT